jgi:hypothetical protein
MQSFIQGQLYRIDANLAELQRLTIKQNELIIVRLRAVAISRKKRLNIASYT